jgi:hypothetical protein
MAAWSLATGLQVQDSLGVFERVAQGPGCAPESALCVFGFLAQL